MNEFVSIENLSTFELNSIIEHLRLGNQHLKNYLNPQQYQDLLNFIKRDDQLQAIASQRLAHLGNVVLTINTIVSSTFGSWLAMVGALGFGSISLSTLLITVGVAFVLSLLAALSTYKTLNAQMNEELLSHDLYHLQIKLLDEINQRKALELSKVAKNLKKQFPRDADYDYESISSIVEWVKKIELVKDEEGKGFKFKANDDPRFVRALRRPGLEAELRIPKTNSFLNTKALRVASELLSITIGGFASTFVYTTGIPDIVEQLGYHHLHVFLTSPKARIIELMLAISLTIFFAIAYLYSYKKSSMRSYISSKAREIFAKKEAELFEKDLALGLLNEFEQNMS